MAYSGHSHSHSKIEEDNTSTYLGSELSDKGGTAEHIKSNIGKARPALITLR